MARGQKTADPDRPMASTGTSPRASATTTPPTRATSPRRARGRLAWVRERDGWVAERGLPRRRAIVTVLPGKVPDGEERVPPGGRFFPTPA